MYLRQVDIVGFRGINRLSIILYENMVLIGENAWGKSSLLDALSLIFNPETDLYQFNSNDFHINYNSQTESTSTITLLFTFCESYPQESNKKYNRIYQPLFSPHQDERQRIYLRITGEKLNDDVVTTYSFLDDKGEQVALENINELVLSLISRHPVYRFRDARLRKHYNNIPSHTLLSSNPKLDEIQLEYQAVVLLLQYYFLSHQQRSILDTLIKDSTVLWARIKSLCMRLAQDPAGKIRKDLFKQLSSLFEPHRNIHFNQYTKPIVLFEDPESRLHPRMIAIAWQLLKYLPIQRITTTNSVELVAQVELHLLCRLVRFSERTKAFQLTPKELGKNDLRRLTFHIHYNRSLALFARMWILVEGETEVWILSELAKLLEINLEMEGIRIVEFAQCGIRPLIKLAKAMGIEWYVLTDGDDAGRKYTETVRSMLTEGENMSSRITTLPKRDIEHFFYMEGFEHIFLQLSHWGNQRINISKVIQKAIQHSSKPDLAIALATEMELQGVQSIPVLFKRLFSKVLLLARS